MHRAIENHRARYLALARISEGQILDIFQRGDDVVDPQTIVVYDYKAPLGVKMVWRFRNSQKRIARVLTQIDANSRNIILDSFGIPHRTEEEIAILGFFAWIANSLTYYSVYLMFQNEITSTSNNLGTLWSDSNEIEFYFQLTYTQQLVLLQKYLDSL